MCALSSSQVLVVIIAHHILAQVSLARVISWSSQVSLARVISWSSHDEHISSTLSPPFSSTSSSSHSSSTSCTSSCTSPTTLRAVVTLRTSPERRWTPLTTPTSSQVTSPSPVKETYVESCAESLAHPRFSSKGCSRTRSTMTPRSRRCFATHAEYMSITPSEKTCLSVSRRRDSLAYRRAAEKGRQAFGTHMVYRETFLQIQQRASSSAPYPQELTPWSSTTEEPLHSSTVEKSERQTQDQDQRCQSGQSAKNSVIFSGGDSSKN